MESLAIETTSSDLNDPLKADFRNFLYLVWKHLGLPDPTSIQYDIAYTLQHGEQRIIIEAFRGVGKSWITSAFVLWLLYCDPQLKILVVSASKSRSDDFSTFTKRLIYEMPILNHLKAREGQRDSNIAFDVGPAAAAHAPSVKSVGITGQMAGSRADVVVADDIEVPNNSLTQAQRDKLANSVKEFDAILTPKTTSRIIFLGTPQTEMSLYNQLEERGYRLYVWPARYPSQSAIEKYGRRLAPFILNNVARSPDLMTAFEGRGAPTEPLRFPDMDLLAREASYGRSGFAMQFMLDTSTSDADRYPLKLADLIVMGGIGSDLAPVSLSWASGGEQIRSDLPVVGLQGDRLHRPIFISKDFIEYQGTVLAVDPAGRGGDELAFAVVSMLNGWLYLRECRGLRGGYSDENLEYLARAAKRYGANTILVESNFGDGMFLKLLTPFLTRIYPCSTEEVRSSIQKEKRIIDTLEPVMNQHKLVVDEGLIKRDYENYNSYGQDQYHKYQLFYQMTRITRDRGSLPKDDRLDVLAMAVAYWVEYMGKDQETAEQEHKDALFEEELDRFLEDAYGDFKTYSNRYIWNTA
ncbi:phage terminase large subunit [Oxalobacter vibrioformis]|uniref:Phage terminase large subunit n=1 Tax=Oxalobacter vibrioformis TaxID=933080 RepID=A0A9E9LVM3_9BURK|nr:phage terminase large subunit [Oxalobacter vibrioformis]WAW10011.1 phage terminase large subunit [Oxalobacter vibrioformis]